MLCSRVQNLLSAYCDRELTGAEMLRVRRHLETCPECRQEYEGLLQVKRLLGALPPPEPRRRFDPAWLEAPGRSGPGRLGRRLRAAWSVFLAGWWAGNPQLQRAAACVAVAAAFVVGGVSTTLLRPRQPADAVTANVPALPQEEAPVPQLPAGMHLHLAQTGALQLPYGIPVIDLVDGPGMRERAPLYPGYAEPFPPRRSRLAAPPLLPVSYGPASP